jgi:hypothetical protein
MKIDPSSASRQDQMLNSADTLAKSFYSAISADLGRVNHSSILTNEATLQLFTENYSNTVFDLVSAGPASDSYEALKATTGKPKVTPSAIFATYLCQTPERKLTTALVISVLLANLVLLRALWSTMTLVAVHIVETQDLKGKYFPLPEHLNTNVLTILPANHCMRCVEYEPIPLSDNKSYVSKTAISSSYVLSENDQFR